MSFLRFIKLTLLRAIDATGINRRLIGSPWRGRHLLIIGWHNVSCDDEHCWNPNLCLTPTTFRSRLEQLREMKCNVLPLGEALCRMSNASLPPRAVALTIDDGDSSCYLRTWPMLREFGYPATLYWTTYYSIHRYAVFDPMLSYLLWKGRNKSLVLRELSLSCNLQRPRERLQAFKRIYELSRANAWTAERKERFLTQLATLLDVDYAEIKAKRILHLISPTEAQLMAAQGLDLQLHTHRHRTPRDANAFSDELQENARIVLAARSGMPLHFCYPSGSFKPEYARWLCDNGILSATTCQSGLVHQNSNPYFLPRMIDHENIRPAEFTCWLSGLAAGLTRQRPMDEHGFA